MSQIQIGRLVLGPPWLWYEAIGDPVTNLGGAAIPAPRQAIRHQVTVSTLSGDFYSDSLAQRLANRRRLRSMFNNTDLKLQGYFYVQYSDDPEQNGWYVPDYGQLQDMDGASGLATGAWKMDLVAWIKAGHLRTNREARNIWMKDLRLGLAWRDTLKMIYSQDFYWLPALCLSQIPPGAVSASNAVNGQRVSLVPMPIGRDGGICQQVAGPIEPAIGNAQTANNINPDLACIAFDRAESSMFTGDQRVLDRRGNLTGPFYALNVEQDGPTSYYRFNQSDVLVDSLGINNGSFFGTNTANLLDATGAWPSFENGVAGMSTDGAGASVVSSSAQAFDGTFSALVTAPTAGGNSDLYVNNAIQTPVVPGVTYAFAYYSRGITAARFFQPSIEWKNAAGQNVGATISGTQILDSTSAWTRSNTVSGIAPAGATHAWFVANRQGCSANEQWYCDAGMAVVGSSVPAYYSNGSWSVNTTGALVGGSDNDGSISFDGTSGYASIPYNSAWATAPLSWEVWCKPTAITGTECVMGMNGGSNVTGIRLYIISSNWSLQIGTGTTSSNHTVTTPPPVAGQWAHCVITYDGAMVRLYINSQLAFSLVVAYTPDANTPLYFARDGGSNIFGGVLDEAAVYPYTLSQQQVANHYSSGVSYDGGNQWEEAYGVDYQWSWTGPDPLITTDTPILDNGLMRVRWSTVGVAGFSIDVWDFTGVGTTNGTPGWAEEGKIMFVRDGDSSNFDTTWVAAGLHTDSGYTLDRAVMSMVMTNPTDAFAREKIFVTMSRGQLGATFEVYPGMKAAGGAADARIVYQTFPTGGTVDSNESVLKIDSQGGGAPWTPGAAAATQSSGPTPGKYIATAGTGSDLFSGGTVGNSNFSTSENWYTLLRCDSAYNVVHPWAATFTVLQAANATATLTTSNHGYGGASSNEIQTHSQNGAGYLSVDLAYTNTQAQQVMEAEAMTLGSGTSSASDPAASGGTTTFTTRTTDANAHTTQATWPNSFLAQYRVFARVKASGNTGSFYAKTGSTTGATVQVAASATPLYTWIDLGEVVANNSTFEVHAWCPSGGTVYVDRIETIQTQDRARTNFIYNGARDNGIQELFDARTMGTVVAR